MEWPRDLLTEGNAVLRAQDFSYTPLLVALAATMAVPTATLAQDVGDDHPAKVSLISDLAAFRPGTSQFLGVHFKLDDGWHIYWAGQNDTGLAPTVDLDLPEGFTAGDILWPTPHRYTSPGNILDHVYEDEVTLLIPITVDDDVEPAASVTISADVEWLVCADVCIPGWGESAISMPIDSADTDPHPGEGFKAVSAARETLPIPAPESQVDFRVEWSGDTAVITPRGRATFAAFYPSPGSLTVEGLLKSGVSKGGPLRLTVVPDFDLVSEHLLDPEAPALAPALRGIVEIRRAPTAPPVRYTIEVPYDSQRQNMRHSTSDG